MHNRLHCFNSHDLNLRRHSHFRTATVKDVGCGMLEVTGMSLALTRWPITIKSGSSFGSSKCTKQDDPLKGVKFETTPLRGSSMQVSY